MKMGQKMVQPAETKNNDSPSKSPDPKEVSSAAKPPRPKPANGEANKGAEGANGGAPKPKFAIKISKE